MVQADIQFNLKNQVTDESYSQGMVEDATLLMLAEKSRFMYAILDERRQKAVVLRDYHLISDHNSEETYCPGFFQRILEEDELLRSIQASRTVLSFFGPHQSLVPDPLFSKDHVREILELSCSPGKNDELYADAIASAHAHLVYAVPAALLEETGNRFQQNLVFHAASAFIESQLRLNKHETEAKISVLLRNRQFDLVITQGNELKLYNSFEIHSSEDFIYFVLFCMEQLQLNPDSVEVRCYGEIEKVTSHWMLGRKYIRNLIFGEKPEGMELSYGFDRYSPHEFYPLLIQRLCVS
ncbi:MAG: DUF3822 family protein [Bacteroidia bacterium]|nr:DUF3822 family protein [Bacteroidia bacterium]